MALIVSEFKKDVDPTKTTFKDIFEGQDEARNRYISGRLGLFDQNKLMEKEELALFDPAKYWQSRKKAWSVYEAKLQGLWLDTFKDAVQSGDSDVMAQAKADTVAEKSYKAYYAIWSKEWPKTFEDSGVEVQLEKNKEKYTNTNPFRKSSKVKAKTLPKIED